jgi:hypothetical protein
MRTQLPPFVLPSYWNEMGLSEKDVYKLAESLPARLFWISCLVHGEDVQAGCLKPSYAQIAECSISYKTQAIRTLITSQKVKFRTVVPVLDTASQASIDHVPPLPTKEVDASQIAAITRLLQPRLSAFYQNQVRGLYEFQGHLYLPVKIEGEAIWLQRVTLYENYERASKKQKFGCATLPCIVQTPDKSTYALCEDGVLLSARQT